MFCLLCAACACGATARAAQNPDRLKPQGYVSDFANVLSPAARTQITQVCMEVDQKAQAQIAVVTVRTMNGQSAFDYSFNLATRWGVGPKQKDRGVLILVAIGDHKYFAQIGYGLEGILPDGKVGGFWREAVPYFRQNNYDAGIVLMTERVAGVIAADRGITLAQQPAVAAPPNMRYARGDAPSTPTELIVILVVLFVIFRIARGFAFAGSSGRYYRRRGGWWVGPMMGGFGGGFGGGFHSGGGFGGFGGGSFGGGGAGGSW